MWSVEPISRAVVDGSEPGVDLTSLDAFIDLYAALGPIGRFAVHLAATVLLATVVLGLVGNVGAKTIQTGRRSPVISVCIGLPLVAIVLGITVTGYHISETNLGAFFGVPMVVFGLLTLPVWTVLGFVAVGQSIGSRTGTDRRWAGVLLGGVVSGLAALTPLLTVVVCGFVAAIGTGAGVRTLLGFRGTTDPSERTVPPANKM